MNASAAKVAAGVSAAYDFSGFRKLVDVGGGHGHFLKELLLGCPELSAVLIDFPDVVAAAHTWRTGDLAQPLRDCGRRLYRVSAGRRRPLSAQRRACRHAGYGCPEDPAQLPASHSPRRTPAGSGYHL